MGTIINFLYTYKFKTIRLVVILSYEVTMMLDSEHFKDKPREYSLLCHYLPSLHLIAHIFSLNRRKKTSFLSIIATNNSLVFTIKQWLVFFHFFQKPSFLTFMELQGTRTFPGFGMCSFQLCSQEVLLSTSSENKQ